MAVKTVPTYFQESLSRHDHFHQELCLFTFYRLQNKGLEKQGELPAVAQVLQAGLAWELKGPFLASVPKIPGRGGQEREEGGRLLAVLASPNTRGVTWVTGHRLGT